MNKVRKCGPLPGKKERLVWQRYQKKGREKIEKS